MNINIKYAIITLCGLYAGIIAFALFQDYQTYKAEKEITSHYYNNACWIKAK